MLKNDDADIRAAAVNYLGRMREGAADAIPAVKELSHLPIIADPAHGTGKWSLVSAVARAGIAAGADGIMVEVHPHPEKALKDGNQSLHFDNFGQLMNDLAPIAAAVNRSM